jgi:hypothetical protein
MDIQLYPLNQMNLSRMDVSYLVVEGSKNNGLPTKAMPMKKRKLSGWNKSSEGSNSSSDEHTEDPRLVAAVAKIKEMEEVIEQLNQKIEELQSKSNKEVRLQNACSDHRARHLKCPADCPNRLRKTAKRRKLPKDENMN